jgi:hypothetical protein
MLEYLCKVYHEIKIFSCQFLRIAFSVNFLVLQMEKVFFFFPYPTVQYKCTQESPLNSFSVTQFNRQMDQKSLNSRISIQ